MSSPQRKKQRVGESHQGTAVNGAATMFPDERFQLSKQLMAACEANDLDRTKLLLEQGADAWIQDDEGWTSLHFAAGAAHCP